MIIKPSDGKIFRHLLAATSLTEATQFDITVKERNIIVKTDKATKFIPKKELSNFATRKLFGFKKSDFKFSNTIQ